MIRYLVVVSYRSRSGVRMDKDLDAEKIMGDGYMGTGFDLRRGRRDISAEYRTKREAVAVARRLDRAGFKVQVVDTRCPVKWRIADPQVISRKRNYAWRVQAQRPGMTGLPYYGEAIPISKTPTYGLVGFVAGLRAANPDFGDIIISLHDGNGNAVMDASGKPVKMRYAPPDRPKIGSFIAK